MAWYISHFLVSVSQGITLQD